MFEKLIFKSSIALGDFCIELKNSLRSGTTHSFGMSYAFNGLDVSDFNRQIKGFIRKLMSFNN